MPPREEVVVVTEMRSVRREIASDDEMMNARRSK